MNTLKLVKDALKYFKKAKTISKKNHVDIEIALLKIPLDHLLKIEHLQRINEFAPGFTAEFCKETDRNQARFTEEVINNEISSICFLSIIVRMGK